ncbi:MAG: beta-ketoacyl synthase N-terminal-like domain-containing protein [Candidatus Omnitrophota bacterium]
MHRNESIAVIGIGCRFPGGANDPESFWKLLAQGKDVIGEIPLDRWDADSYFDPDPSAPGKTHSKWGGFLHGAYPSEFDAAFFAINPKEAAVLDPQQRLLLETSWEALENAGIPPAIWRGRPAGVYLGVCANDYQGASLWANDPAAINIYSATGSAFCSAGGRLSYFYGFEGPNVSIDTACSSSLTAFHYACQGLKNGECDLALALGVNSLLTPNLYIYLSKLGVLSPDGRCKAFDASANGYVRAEGCGAVVLKRHSDAIKDGDNVLSLIRATAITQDGKSGSLISPNGGAQAAMLREALHRAGLAPDDIGYIETHGTGTPMGDIVEIEALGKVFGQRRKEAGPLYIGSVKTNIGHLEGAAGIAGLIKTILSLQKEAIPPHLHFRTPNPAIAWKQLPFQIPTQTISWPHGGQSRRAGVSSFGLSGTNVHAIVEEAPFPTPERMGIGAQHASDRRNAAFEDHSFYLLPLSARDEAALRDLARRYADWLNQNPDIDIGNACYTASVGRTHFPRRLAVVGADANDIRLALENFLHGVPSKSLFIHNSHELIETAKSYASLETNELFLPCLPGKKDRNEIIVELAEPYIRGMNIDWRKFYASRSQKIITLPTYPFQRKQYYIHPLSFGKNKNQFQNGVKVTAYTDKNNIDESRLRAELASSPHQARKSILNDFVQKSALAILGNGEKTALFDNRPLVEQGFDSLTAVELRTKIGNALKISIPVTFLFNYPTIRDIVRFLNEDGITALDEKPNKGKRVESSDEEFEFINDLSDDDLAKFIEKDIESL